MSICLSTSLYIHIYREKEIEKVGERERKSVSERERGSVKKQKWNIYIYIYIYIYMCVCVCVCIVCLCLILSHSLSLSLYIYIYIYNVQIYLKKKEFRGIFYLEMNYLLTSTSRFLKKVTIIWAVNIKCFIVWFIFNFTFKMKRKNQKAFNVLFPLVTFCLKFASIAC